jgi:hypothetical protein
VGDNPDFRVLIREEGMAMKPSIVFSLSVEQILQYWSLLSPEQKEAFLLTHIPKLWNSEFMVLSKGKRQTLNTMFDKFAGIFHAFNRLESSVRMALNSHHWADAEYRLLGEKYDSLPSLVQKVVNEIEGDAVNQYITLLCAKAVMQRIATKYHYFQRKHRRRWKEIGKILEYSETIKERIVFDPAEERRKFFDWFERMFFMEVPIPTSKEDDL